MQNKAEELYHVKNSSPAVLTPRDSHLFDLLVTYSIQDRVLAEDSLAPALEQGPGPSYRLCLHHRDFPSSSHLCHSISVAAESSSITLLLLSPSFLATQWPLVRDSILSLPPSRLLLLQVAPLSPQDLVLHPQLRRLMSSCPLLTWGQPSMWTKLRSLLPEPVYLTFQRNVALRRGGGTDPPNIGPDVTEGWTYFIEESSSSNADTNSTEMSDSCCLTSSPASFEHSYCSIQDGGAGIFHHYHTLEPGQGGVVTTPLFTLVTGEDKRGLS